MNWGDVHWHTLTSEAQARATLHLIDELVQILMMRHMEVEHALEAYEAFKACDPYSEDDNDPED